MTRKQRIATYLAIVSVITSIQQLQCSNETVEQNLSWKSLSSIFSNDKTQDWISMLSDQEKEEFFAMMREIDLFLSYGESEVQEILESHPEIATKFFAAQKTELINLVLQLGSEQEI
ncbi:MAG TPA: hypothetical protein VHA52_12755 [Candidatus Babeliaceae bacterium]|nr:hypothetical protein [Candidatus Babeliaceae bacterium]